MKTTMSDIANGNAKSVERAQVVQELKAVAKQHAQLNKQLAKLTPKPAPEVVQNYALDTANGAVQLSDLFGKHDELIVIHNMGAGCAYCTLWADGFNGVVPHLENRAGFVVVSPDAPAAQAKFAASRGWTFKMASAHNSNFTHDLGFASKGNHMPGVSTFKKQKDGSIVRVNKAVFGPGDLFCGVYHLFDLLPAGRKGWGPQMRY